MTAPSPTPRRGPGSALGEPHLAATRQRIADVGLMSRDFYRRFDRLRPGIARLRERAIVRDHAG